LLLSQSLTQCGKGGGSRYFQSPETADADGLVRVGGQLTPDWLLDAYTHGIFPWPLVEEYELLAWWSPDPRAIIELDQLRISRRLARRSRSPLVQVTSNQRFSDVIRCCASVQDRQGNTWLTAAMIEAYIALHELGYAHSVEVWREGILAGGIYGVAVGGMFAAESMFYHQRDASKVALVHLVRHLASRGYRLFDIQQLTPHAISLGATAIGRDGFLARLATAVAEQISFGGQLEGHST
jgi:leucyl/phenylalanyl-tRNA--protein transferase